MLRHSIVCFAVGLLAASQNALAAGADCSNAIDQASMTACADKALKASDAQLNKTYRALLAKSSAAGKQNLQAAERAWIAYRDAQCTFNTLGSAGGSVHALAYASCATGLTDAQNEVLNAQLHCEEGDTSCGSQ